MTAVVAALDGVDARRHPATLLKTTGMTLVSTVGGASGRCTARCSCGWPAAPVTRTSLDAAAVRRRPAGRARGGRRARQGGGRATRRCTTRWRRPATRSTRRSPTGADSADGAGGGRRRPPTAGRDATIPMLARKGRASLPRRAQRRPPGPGRDLDRAAGRDRGRTLWRLTGRHDRDSSSSPTAAPWPRRPWRSPRRWCTAGTVRIEVAAGLDDDDVRHRRDRDRRRPSTPPTTATASSCSWTSAAPCCRPSWRSTLLDPDRPRAGGAVPGAARRGPGRRRGRRGRRGRPRRGGRRGDRRRWPPSSRMWDPPDASSPPTARRRRSGRRAGRRDVRVGGREDRQPARPARPAGRPAGAGGAAVRRADRASQPRHRSRARSPPPACRRSPRSVRCRGHRVELTATGSQAREALDHVVALADRRFDEQESVVPSSPASSAAAACARRADARLARHRDRTGPLDARGRTSRSPTSRHRTTRPSGVGSVERSPTVRREIQRIRGRAPPAKSARAKPAIFDAHLHALDDTDLLDDVRDLASTRAPRRPGPGPTRSPTSRREFDGVSDDPTSSARAARRARGRTSRCCARRSREHRRRGVDGRRRPDRRRPHAGPGGRSRPGARDGPGAGRGGARPGTARSWPGPAASPRWSAAGPAVLDVSPTARRSRSTARTGELRRRPRRRRRCAELASSRSATLARRRRSRKPRAPAPAVTCGRRRGPRRRQPRIARRCAGRGAANGADLAGLVRTEFLFLGRDDAPDRRRAGRGVPGASPRRSADGASPCAPSTSAATSRFRTRRSPPRPTRSSACAASGSR